ncbi:MAG: SIMPL domain-containing protein [Candidatus Caenarcaniphilales bacterium]|nr:SIMPL domain-containing protein [Candidatus Caenarcaniphilales bacterium]
MNQNIPGEEPNIEFKDESTEDKPKLDYVQNINNFSFFWLGLGIIIAALIISSSFLSWKNSSKTVTVRGFSERMVNADLALWPVQAKVTANTLVELHQALEASQVVINNFFNEQGFKPNEINAKQTRITDRQAQLYSTDNVNNLQRYVADFGFLIKTKRMDLVKSSLKEINKLVGQGVTLSSNEVEYLYTKLNEIKPEMIKEATVEAKKAAEEFALNSDSKIASLKSASQGLFTIEPIHYYTQDLKKVRVVTNLVYGLKK